jgi:hypothetical protein
MAKLISLEDWKNQRIESAVTLRTIQNWAKYGYIPGAKKIGRRWWIDPEIEQNCTGNPLIDQVLGYGTATAK